MDGKIGLVMLVVKDLNRSVAFYRDVIGMKVKFQAPEWATLDAGGVELGLHPESEHLHVKPSESFGFGFYVNDIERVHQELKNKNVHFILPPKEENFGWLALFSDPDGYHIQLCQLAAQSSKSVA
jgi:lactoylglutathione lyase